MQALAAAGKLPPDDVSGGTLTVSNIGTIGGRFATPLVYGGESAIVALGRLQVRCHPTSTAFQGTCLAARWIAHLRARQVTVLGCYSPEAIVHRRPSLF
jgi:hypothetical protein